MRQIQVLVSEPQYDEVAELLESEDIDFVRQEAWTNGEQLWLVTFPLPTDALGYILQQLERTGLGEHQYKVVSSVETATTPHFETLRDRFSSDFDPLTAQELRSKVLDISHDARSFLSMIFLSAIIATAGLLTDSAAIVVGSMVIAPIIGPVLTAGVGAATGDRKMLLHSTWLQGAGLVVAVVGAWAFSLGLQFGGFVSPALDVSSIDLIALRIAPGILTVAVGIAAGAAGAFGLVTKGPTSLIGVMIAAALIPSAATTGIAAAWNEPRIAIGSAFLLVLSLLLINGAAYGMLRVFKYRSRQDGWLFGGDPKQVAAVAITVVLLLSVVALVGVASIQQIGFERTVTAEVESVVDEPEHNSIELVDIRVQHTGLIPAQSTLGVGGQPETITVLISQSGGGDPPEIAGEIEDRIEAETDETVTVRVQFIHYQLSDHEQR